MKVAVGKGVNAITVNQDLSKIPSLAGIMQEEGKIQDIRVDLTIGPICFLKISLCRPLDIGGPSC